MPVTTRIYRRGPRISLIANTAVLLFCSYDLIRIYLGTNPYWTPRLEAAGLMQKRSGKTGDRSDSRLGAWSDRKEGDEDSWVSLNGIPVPTFELLMKPFRRGQ